MAELGVHSDIHPIHNIPHIHQHKRESVMDFYPDNAIHCEGCPGAKICKKIGNFRKSCESSNANYTKDMSMTKCIVANNILLAKLLGEKL